MRITSNASKELVKLIKKENSTKDFLKNKLQIKAKIVGVRGNEVTVMFKNGLEIKATSNIPLENFVGSQILFRLINSEEGLFLRPKIEGKAMEMEMSLKIDDLVNRLEVMGTKENRDIIAEMIKQNIPITKQNFEQVKESIKAFDMISHMSENEINELLSELENPENMEMKDVIKRVIAFKEGTNLSEFIKDVQGLHITKEDIMFLLKNNIKISYENLKNFENFMNQSDDIENLANDIKESLANIDVESGGIEKGFESASQKKSKFEISDFKSLDFKNFEEESEVKFLNTETKSPDKIKKQLMNILEGYAKNLNEENKIVPGDIKKDLNEIMKLVKELGDGLDGRQKEDFAGIENRLSLLDKLSNDYMYLQVPFMNEEYKSMTELLFKEKTEKRGRFKNDKSVNVLISLNTKNMDRVDTLLVYYKESLNLVFNFQNEEIRKVFERKHDQIKNLMKSIGFEDISVMYKVREENSTLMERLRYSNRNDRNLTFDVWV